MRSGSVSRTSVAVGVYGLLGVAAVMSAHLGGGFAEPLGAPQGLFWLVAVGAGGCALAAAWLLSRARRHDVAEQGFLGALLWCVSVLPLAHGLTIPGVLVGDNPARAFSVWLALPLGAVAAVPLLLPRGRLSVGLARRWRAWTALHVAVATVFLDEAVDLLLAHLEAEGRPTATGIFQHVGTPVGDAPATTAGEVCATLG